ncbi:hypothetical protein BC835DRAFT_1307869 [Cytidiella melzeri]|nr:hypothetical protein BC835DRAFT_1307869 [Cytidiella melzeri]
MLASLVDFGRMAKRKLRNLKNLGSYVHANTKRTQLAKAGKENQAPPSMGTSQPILPTQAAEKGPSPATPLSSVLNQQSSFPRTVNRVANPFPSLSQTSQMLSNLPEAVETASVATEELFETDGADIDAAAGESMPELEAEEESEDEASDHDEESEDEHPGDPTTAESTSQAGGGMSWEERKPPTVGEAVAALKQLTELLEPQRGKGKSRGYRDGEFDRWTRKHLELMAVFLNLYTSPTSNVHNMWMDASKQAAAAIGTQRGRKGETGKKEWWARRLRKRTKAFIATRNVPQNPYGTTKSKVDTDDELARDIKLHLQAQGNAGEAWAD